MESSLHARNWGAAKQGYENLRDTMGRMLGLNISCGNFKPGMRKLKTRLGFPGSLVVAQEEIKRHRFDLAIRALVMTDTPEKEQDLYDAIDQQLSENMDIFGRGPESVPVRLSVLESFLKDVGENPPDILRGIWGQAKNAVHGNRSAVEHLASTNL